MRFHSRLLENKCLHQLNSLRSQNSWELFLIHKKHRHILELWMMFWDRANSINAFLCPSFGWRLMQQQQKKMLLFHATEKWKKVLRNGRCLSPDLRRQRIVASQTYFIVGYTWYQYHVKEHLVWMSERCYTRSKIKFWMRMPQISIRLFTITSYL